MGARTLRIWSPRAAATLAGRAREEGWVVVDSDLALLAVDARDDPAAALTMLREAGAGWSLALVTNADTALQDALIDAGARQVAVVAADGDGFAPALRLAGRALDTIGERRAPVASANSPELAAWIDARLAAGQPVAVVSVALLRLDLVNAAHGRATGTALVDAAERRVAAQLSAIAEDDGRMARVAGPGFLAAVAGGAERAVTAAARIEEALARRFRFDGMAMVLGADIDLVAARPGDDGAALIARTLAAAVEAPVAADDPLAVDIHRALGRNEIAILFQPQASLADGTITGVEALARWRHPARGELGAEALIGAATRAGIGVALSEHIQRAVLGRVAAWPAALGGLRVSLNLTAADLARPGFVETTLARIDASGVARGRLTLEVTETELMADLDAAGAVLGALQDAGCRIAIDDFGTGYSSLAYLAALPIDYLKLDRSLVVDIVGDERARVVVSGAIDMARSLGLAVVAEGVEDETQRAALAAAGCALFQGFLLAPPLDEAALAALVEGAVIGRVAMIALAPVLLAAAPVPETAILVAMSDSAAGWNAGDLDRFVAVYADDAVYVTGKGLVRGRAAIADRYRKSFVAGGNARGRLTFAEPVFRAIDPRHELMWARWVLTPAAGGKVESGMTTLLFERRLEKWRIISDHSS